MSGTVRWFHRSVRNYDDVLRRLREKFVGSVAGIS